MSSSHCFENVEDWCALSCLCSACRVSVFLSRGFKTCSVMCLSYELSVNVGLSLLQLSLLRVLLVRVVLVRATLRLTLALLLIGRLLLPLLRSRVWARLLWPPPRVLLG